MRSMRRGLQAAAARRAVARARGVGGGGGGGVLAQRSPLSSAAAASAHASADTDSGPLEKMTMVAAIADGLRVALRSDPTAVVFGEDVAFGGVFRATLGLREEFGPTRVLNMPINEQGLVGFGIGLSAVGGTAIAEVQFADYIFPAMDQICNEAAKFRYRSGSEFDVGAAPHAAAGHHHTHTCHSPLRTPLRGARAHPPRARAQAG